MKHATYTTVLCLAVMSGCGDQGVERSVGPQLGQTQSAVFNGRDDYTSTHVVGVVMGPNGANGTCTGTLIAPNLVLTAYHCVAEIAREAVICGQTQFGPKYPPGYFQIITDYNSYEARTAYAVQQVFGPNGSPDICGGDIALLWLRDPIPTDVARPAAPRLELAAQSREPVSAVGYGLGSNNQYSAGVRRRRDDGQVNCVGCNHQGVHNDEIVATAFTCSGDSGGPLFDVEQRIIGVTSRGPDGCDQNTNIGVYSSVYQWRDWIRATTLEVSDRSGMMPPSWARPAVIDTDADQVGDDVDNCVGLSNPDQADLDEDGQGDACDQRLDRHCSVCQICAQDDECGPGAYCGDDSRCYMSCRTNADCPGGDTTICQDFGTFSTCVNSGYQDGELCPENYVCGQAIQPRPDPSTHEDSTPPRSPDDAPTPNEAGILDGPEDAQNTRTLECWSPDGSRKSDEFCPTEDEFSQRESELAEPTLNPFGETHCSTTVSTARPTTLSVLMLLGLFLFRRSRRI